MNRDDLFSKPQLDSVSTRYRDTVIVTAVKEH